MSIRQMSLVWRLPAAVTPTTRLVLLKLADHADSDGICWPGTKHIARDTGLSDRTVRRTMRTCERMGLVESEARPGMATRYRLKLAEWLAEYDAQGADTVSAPTPDTVSPPGGDRQTAPTPDTGSAEGGHTRPQGRTPAPVSTSITIKNPKENPGGRPPPAESLSRFLDWLREKRGVTLSPKQAAHLLPAFVSGATHEVACRATPAGWNGDAPWNLCTSITSAQLRTDNRARDAEATADRARQADAAEPMTDADWNAERERMKAESPELLKQGRGQQ